MMISMTMVQPVLYAVVQSPVKLWVSSSWGSSMPRSTSSGIWVMIGIIVLMSGGDQFFFSLIYTLFFIMVIAKIYVNDGRVQLFKSTSKLGDNHQRRETMTLAGEMN